MFAGSGCLLLLLSMCTLVRVMCLSVLPKVPMAVDTLVVVVA